jgi:hypothetical protein
MPFGNTSKAEFSPISRRVRSAGPGLNNNSFNPDSKRDKLRLEYRFANWGKTLAA